ncbi:MAG: ABC transporter permease subunit [Myxococcota bacterium]
MIRITLRFAWVFASGLLRRAPMAGIVGAIGLTAVFALALLAPLGGYPIGADVDPSVASQGPSAAHWLGTDHLGRDVAWRTALASRAFVGPGLVACAVAVGAGVPLGAAAGWSNGPLGLGIRAGIGVVDAIPRVVLVVLGCAIHGSTAGSLAVIAGLATAPALASAVLERIERLRIEEFVLASRAHGLSDARILAVHLVGIGCGRTIGRRSCEAFGAFVVLECTLSYLGGFGVQEPTPSWGNMLAFEWGRGLGPSVWAPALALWATVTACALTSRLFAEVDDG